MDYPSFYYNMDSRSNGDIYPFAGNREGLPARSWITDTNLFLDWEFSKTTTLSRSVRNGTRVPLLSRIHSMLAEVHKLRLNGRILWSVSHSHLEVSSLLGISKRLTLTSDNFPISLMIDNTCFHTIVSYLWYVGRQWVLYKVHKMPF